MTKARRAPAPYRRHIEGRIAHALKETGAEPVIFVGAGLSKRYLDAPSWKSLLQSVLDRIGNAYPVEYYVQREGDLIGAARAIAGEVHAWAWSGGRSCFPEELFAEERRHTDFIKHLVAEEIAAVTERAHYRGKEDVSAEVERLAGIRTHAIVTTNYDTFLEDLFAFRRVCGVDSVVHDSARSGFVIKVHGCCTQPDSIVLLPEDYESISLRHKYIFAKLLTYFSERVVLFAGYSMSDPDIQALLIDAAEALRRRTLENVFFLSYAEEPELAGHGGDVGEVAQNGRSARFRRIRTRAFDWVFEAMGRTVAHRTPQL